MSEYNPWDDAVLRAAMDSFPATDPRIDIWARYPDVSEEEDDATDTFACDSVANAFTGHLRDRGIEAVTVRVEFDQPWLDYHVWTRVTIGGHTIDVDWTSRQYHNLDDERGVEALISSWPVMWSPSDRHPIAGPFARAEIVG